MDKEPRLKITFASFAILVLGLFTPTQSALAEPAPAERQALEICNSYDKIVSHLQQTYKEERSGTGLIDNKGLLQLSMSKDGATWTILSRSPQPGAAVCMHDPNRWDIPEIIGAFE